MSALRTMLKELVSSPPAPVSAEVLADGVTLRVTFSKAVSGTADLGFTWTEGAISAGAISTAVVDLTVATILAEADGGSIDYDATTGDLVGADSLAVYTFTLAVTNNSEQVE